MNFTEIARAMHWKTGKSASNLIRKHENNKELKPYILRDLETGRIIGLKQEGLEVLRNLGYQKPQPLELAKQDLELIELNHKIELLEQELKGNERLLQYLTKDKERLEQENQQLKAELEQHKSLGFFKSLLGYKK
jgi:hypothetical protein